jgi:RHS repeat-associated protein
VNEPLHGNPRVSAHQLERARQESPLRKPSNFLADASGNTLALADSTGAIQTQYSYEPFGNTTVAGTSTNPFQYTGRENDGTGLLYYRLRYYNPILQRFVSEDPIGLDGGLNVYAYVGNDPVNFADPFGLKRHRRPRPGAPPCPGPQGPRGPRPPQKQPPPPTGPQPPHGGPNPPNQQNPQDCDKQFEACRAQGISDAKFALVWLIGASTSLATALMGCIDLGPLMIPCILMVDAVIGATELILLASVASMYEEKMAFCYDQLASCYAHQRLYK